MFRYPDVAEDASVGRLVWGWVQEAADRTYDNQMYQGWAGVMSLPRTLTLEYVTWIWVMFRL